jgi:hypothetical protein
MQALYENFSVLPSTRLTQKAEVRAPDAEVRNAGPHFRNGVRMKRECGVQHFRI